MVTAVAGAKTNCTNTTTASRSTLMSSPAMTRAFRDRAQVSPRTHFFAGLYGITDSSLAASLADQPSLRPHLDRVPLHPAKAVGHVGLALDRSWVIRYLPRGGPRAPVGVRAQGTVA